MEHNLGVLTAAFVEAAVEQEEKARAAQAWADSLERRVVNLERRVRALEESGPRPSVRPLPPPPEQDDGPRGWID